MKNKKRITKKNRKSKKTSFWGSIPKVLKIVSGIIAGIAGLIAGVTALYNVLVDSNLINIKKPYNIEVKCLDVFPFSLKNSVGTQDFLYWLHIRVNNKSSNPLHLEVSFQVRQGPAQVSNKPAIYTVNPKEELFQVIDPAFEFLRHDINANLELTWKVSDEKKNILNQGTKKILVLPKNILDWNLTTPEGKPIPRDFLIASLTAWVLTPDPTIKKYAMQLQKGIESQFDPLLFANQWFALCYNELFHSSPGSKILSDLKVSMKGRQQIKEPSQVLLERHADPLESVLLLSAISHDTCKKLGVRLVMFVIPEDQKISYLLGWTTDTGDWHAVDMTDINNMAFEMNEELSTSKVNELLKENPRIIKAIDTVGVFFAKERSLIALDFFKAAKKFYVRSLP
jgi:hypothetical protein